MHQPRFVLNAAKMLTATFFATSLAAVFFPATAIASPNEIGYVENRILELHNAERAARGIRPLTSDGRLQQVAQQWAAKLASEGTIYHIQTLPARGFGFRAGGENIAYRAPSMTAEYANIQWMGSDLHRKNLLDPAFSHAGVGVSCATFQGRFFTVAVVEFGADASPSTTVPPAQPRVATGDGMNGRAVTCQGFANPVPQAPILAAPPAAAPVIKAATGPAPKPASVPRAPKPVPVPAQIEVPPPGAPPVRPGMPLPVVPAPVAPAPVEVAPPAPEEPPAPVEPAPVKPAEVPEPEAPRQIETQPAVDSIAPVADRDETAIASGMFFLASLASWLVSGLLTSRKVRQRRAAALG